MSARSEARASSPPLRPPLSQPLPREGGEAFAQGAGRLAGVAGAVLGWRPGEFWAATPAELAAVLRVLAPDGDAVADAGDLRRLMEMFPDA